MLTATPVFLLQATSALQENTPMILTALSLVATIAVAGAILTVRRARSSEPGTHQPNGRTAMRPVPTEETERRLAEPETATPSDHVARQRLKHLSDATGDHRT